MRRSLLHCWFISILITSANRVSGLNNEKLDAGVESAKNDEHEIDKRAPMGFQGVRGKKSSSQSPLVAASAFADNIIGPDDRHSFVRRDLDKRAPMMGFQGVRGKKFYPFENNINSYGKIPNEMYKDNMIDKRVKPMIGFVGPRGKKDYEEENPNMQNSDISTLDNYNNYHYFDSLDDLLNSAFDRTRKEQYEYSPSLFSRYEQNKRAPSGQFFGMRGKRQPAVSSGFFGMRGKKFPYEFRGKFVGVRGKKMLPYDDSDVYPNILDDKTSPNGMNDIETSDLMKNDHLRDDDLDFNQLMWMLEKRRAPDGFLGVRGKRNAN